MIFATEAHGGPAPTGDVSKIDIAATAERTKQAVIFETYFAKVFPESYQDNRSARCPNSEAHRSGDSSPSFQIDNGFGYCHAGCKSPNGGDRWDIFDLEMLHHGHTDYRRAVLSLAREYDCLVHRDSLKVSDRKSKWIYHDAQGDRYMMIKRVPLPGEGKRYVAYRPDGPEGWVASVNDVPRVLYRLPEVIANKEIWIAEGEKCADALTDLGFCGTTSPFGAGKWKGVCVNGKPPESLTGKQVFIVPDNDAPGRKHAQDVAGSLKGFASQVQQLDLTQAWPELPAKGDVVDLVEHFGPEKARSMLEDLARKTPASKKRRPMSFAELKTSDIPPVAWVVPGLLPEGLTLLSGDPKVGKSWLALNLCLTIATGQPVLGKFPCQPSNTLYFAFEDAPRRLKERTEQILEDAPWPEKALLYCDSTIFDPAFNGGKSIAEVLSAFLDEYPGTTAMFLDTWARVQPNKRGGQTAYDGDYKALGPLQSFALDTHIALVLVHHNRKEEAEDKFTRVSGSTAMTGAADSVWVLGRERKRNAQAHLLISGRDIDLVNARLSFDSDRGLWTWIGDDSESFLNDEQLKVLEALKSSAVPLTLDDIRQRLGLQRNEYEALRKRVSRMCSKGMIHRPEAGRFMLPPVSGH